MDIRPTGRLVWALLAAGLACMGAWALTADFWWALVALVIGAGLLVASLRR